MSNHIILGLIIISLIMVITAACISCTMLYVNPSTADVIALIVIFGICAGTLVGAVFFWII